MFGEAAFHANPFTSHQRLAIKSRCAVSSREEKKLTNLSQTISNQSLCAGSSEASNVAESRLLKVKTCCGVEWLRLVGGAGRRRLVVAAVHLLLHGAVLLQLLAGVVGDLQEAAGLHHHVGLAGVRQDGVLRNHLQALVTSGFQSDTYQGLN